MAFLDYAGLQRYHNTLLDSTLTSNKKAAPADKVGELSDDISAKPDIDLGITGASVGNYAKVKTVDANGKPTSWEYGSGGGGGGGGTSDYADLTNKPSINNVTLSGNKSASDLGLGTYSKPNTGIPATDLASAVQTSLGKADSALQAVPATYRTASAQDTIDAGKIDKPNSPATGAFLVYNGSAWVAQTVPSANGVSF